MMNTVIRVVIFLLINFLALGIGGYFTGDGVSSNWYQELNQAPWTPPGWVFGMAWTTIMIFFAFYLTRWYNSIKNKQGLIMLFAIQWILNVIWNPIFFYFRDVSIGLVVIILLTVLVGYLLVRNYRIMNKWSVLILPYFTWLCIATSLNFYIWLNN